MEALEQEIASGDQSKRLGPPALYGAVGLAMFKADLGGLPINRKIDAVGNAAFEALTRPTADLGEDGELVAGLHEDAKVYDSMLHRAHAARCQQAADRLILYRVALERIAAEASVSVDSPVTMCAAWRGIAVERIDIARAVLSRSGERMIVEMDGTSLAHGE